MLNEVGVSTLSTVEQVLLLRCSGLGSSGIGVRVWDLCGFAALTNDSIAHPEVKKGGRGRDQDHVARATVRAFQMS